MKKRCNPSGIKRKSLLVAAVLLIFLGISNCADNSSSSSSSDNAITAFSFLAENNDALSSDVDATVDGTNISATVPNGTGVAALVATFTTTGESVAVGDTTQVSGTTANDFSSEVTYTVTAENGSTKDYAVTVTIGDDTSGDGDDTSGGSQAATPTFSPDTGTYTSSQSVTISCTTSGATIYYTTDGTTPTSSSTLYSSAVTISSTTTLKAIAAASGYTDSEVASATYTMQIPVSSWSFVDGDGTYGINQDTSESARRVTMVEYNSKLYAAWMEDLSGTTQIRVKVYDGSSWSSVDGGATTGLNRDSANNAENPSLAVYNSKLYLAWDEFYSSRSQIRVKAYDGSSWSFVDGGAVTGLNYDTGQNAALTSMSVYDSKLYLAWHEDNQIRVKVYDGSSWSFADGGGATGLNKDTSKSASYVSLIVFDSKLYAAWQEPDSLSKEQIRVKVYDGSSWSFVDGDAATGLNYNTAAHSKYVSTSVYNSKLYVAWQEFDSTFQIRVKVYDGSSWSFVDGGGTTGLNKDTSESGENTSMSVFNAILYLTWNEANGSNKKQIRVKSYDGSSWSFVDGNGDNGLNKDSSVNASYPVAYVFDSKLYIAWNEYVGAENQARVISGQ